MPEKVKLKKGNKNGKGEMTFFNGEEIEYSF